jgi:hypothetical protein
MFEACGSCQQQEQVR